MFIPNREEIAKLVKEVKEKYPHKTIWCYTGYTFEELMEQEKEDKNLQTILQNIDVLLDGRFILKLANEKIHYVGSENQRIIDVKETLKKKKIKLYIDNSSLFEKKEVVES